MVLLIRIQAEDSGDLSKDGPGEVVGEWAPPLPARSLQPCARSTLGVVAASDRRQRRRRALRRPSRARCRAPKTRSKDANLPKRRILICACRTWPWRVTERQPEPQREATRHGSCGRERRICCDQRVRAAVRFVHSACLTEACSRTPPHKKTPHPTRGALGSRAAAESREPARSALRRKITPTGPNEPARRLIEIVVVTDRSGALRLGAVCPRQSAIRTVQRAASSRWAPTTTRISSARYPDPREIACSRSSFARDDPMRSELARRGSDASTRYAHLFRSGQRDQYRSGSRDTR